MLHELRISQARSAEDLAAYADVFRRVAEPLFKSCGCAVLCAWRSEEAPPLGAYLLEFRDRAHREASYKTVLANERIVAEYLPRRSQLLDTDVPPLSWLLEPAPGLELEWQRFDFYEPRMYTPFPGKMAEYAEVFRIDVKPVFEKLDVAVLGGWAGTQMEESLYAEKPGAPQPFVYLIACRSRAVREAAFAKLRELPEMARYMPKRTQLIDPDVPTRNWFLAPID